MVNHSELISKLVSKDTTHVQLSTPQLVTASLRRGEGALTDTGALRAETGKYTGRSPKDRFIVEDNVSDHKIDWGTVNQPISEEVFDSLFEKVVDYLNSKEETFVFNGYAGADEKTRLDLQVINEFSWHNLFVQNLFIRPDTKEEALNIDPEFTIVSAPNFKADPETDGTNSEAFVIISLKKGIILKIGRAHV